MTECHGLIADGRGELSGSAASGTELRQDGAAARPDAAAAGGRLAVKGAP